MTPQEAHARAVTDLADQAVQRVLALAVELEAEANRCSSVEARISLRDAANRARAAVAGPQRDHDEEGGQPPSGFPGGPDRQMWKFR